ncbi:MAG: serine hydrolase domain-containing protein [Promethearchaeota archaeon]
MASGRAFWITLFIISIVFHGANSAYYEPLNPFYVAAVPDYWPTDGWRSTSPEAQGMSSAQLQVMEAYIRQLYWGHLVRSVLIIRNGYIVWETYFDSAYGQNHRGNIYSCTKSVTSALIGMAIDEGHIVGVNESMVSFFPERTIANRTSEKEAITIEHLLTMESGLAWYEWPYGSTSSFTYMINSPDWVQYTLDQPMRYEPGAVWDYNSGGSHLLSMIVNQTVGDTTLAYADSHLFSPLGITEYNWETDPQGVVFGGSDLHLTPRDMAKFGFLYLNNGTWDGEQLIPSSWVNLSTTHHETPYNDTDTIGYGYQWWLNLPIDAYVAIGYNGQQINVVPEHNLIVVFTAAYEDATFAAIMEDYIIPAIGYQPPLRPPFPFTFDQIITIGIALMAIMIAIPICVEAFFLIRDRRKLASIDAESEESG